MLEYTNRQLDTRKSDCQIYQNYVFLISKEFLIY